MQKLAVIFGGNSTEHSISIISAKSIVKNIEKDKYEINLVYIDRSGIWYKCDESFESKTEESEVPITEKIENIIEFLKNMDVIFPVLHGKMGEDGTIQGLFEIIQKPYVGCGVLASAVGMDKVYTKAIFEKAGILQAKYIYIKAKGTQYVEVDSEFNENIKTIEDISKRVIEKLGLPVFVKPSNSGSSVGVKKAESEEQIIEAIKFAQQYDTKILIEEAIRGREIECAVLELDEIKTSCVGEVLSAEDFYSYDAKYKNNESKTVIPANIPQNIEDEIRKLAKKAFLAIDGKGLSRVDFFYDEKNNKIYINEINTLPGFTSISMYPKLFEQVGISYKELINNLIKSAHK